nr:desulfoferrodoxin family protein [Candidatus Gracilibacteria bacterium]
MRYLCTNCSHIYDESIGDLEEGYEPGVKLYDMQDYFVCPVCSEGIDSFQEIVEEVNYIEDKDNMTGVEEEHYPIIIEEDKKIKVKVGKEESHPSIGEHFISSISLYDEYGDLVEEKFLNESDEGSAVFDNYDLDEYEVRITCNLHGVWSLGKIKREEI